MKVIKTIKDKILFAYQLVAAITLVVLIAAAAIQVVTRYVIAQPPGWTDELARFAFVWCSALGAVVALDKGMHAGITLLEEKLPEAGRRVLKIICTILVIAMAALVGVKGVSLVSVTVTVLSARPCTCPWPSSTCPSACAASVWRWWAWCSCWSC